MDDQQHISRAHRGPAKVEVKEVDVGYVDAALKARAELRRGGHGAEDRAEQAIVDWVFK